MKKEKLCSNKSVCKCCIIPRLVASRAEQVGLFYNMINYWTFCLSIAAPTWQNKLITDYNLYMVQLITLRWRARDLPSLSYIFLAGYSIYFFLIFAQLWEFWDWGFGVGVSDWVFGFGVFSWCGLGLCCGAIWVLWVWALYINIEEYPWEKNFAWWGAQDLASLTAPITNHCSWLTGQIIDRVFTSQVMIRSSS